MLAEDLLRINKRKFGSTDDKVYRKRYRAFSMCGSIQSDRERRCPLTDTWCLYSLHLSPPHAYGRTKGAVYLPVNRSRGSGERFDLSTVQVGEGLGARRKGICQ